MLTQWKQEPATSFLSQAYFKSLQIVLEALGQAIVDAKSKASVAGVSTTQYPVFKKRGVNDSFSFNGNIKHDAENGRIFVPKIRAEVLEILAIIGV